MKQIQISFLVLFLSILLSVAGVDAKEFLVGVDIPMTGSIARVGNETLEGIKTAVEVFNKKNRKHTIKLAIIDNESQPAKAVAAVEKLVSQGVVAIDGGYGTNLIGPASTAANKAGVVYMTSGGVGKGLTDRGFKTFFRLTNMPGYTKAFVNFLTERGIKSVSIISSSLQSCDELGKDVAAGLRARGVKVTVHGFEPSMTDFKPIINKIKAIDHPDAIFMSAMENDYVGILRAANVLKPDVKVMIGTWGVATAKMSKEFPALFKNVLGTTLIPFPVEYKTKEGLEFAAAFKKQHKKEPDYLAQLGYVQTQILCEAIVAAHEKGTLANGGLINEIRKFNRQTLIGQVSFDNDGDNNNYMLQIAQHQNGKIPVIWPKEYANGKINYPAIPW